MATSLVTGGAGFMGSHVAEHLLLRGHEVLILDDLSGGFEENLPAGAEFIQASILDHELLDRLFDWHRFDYVLPLCQRESFANTSASPMSWEWRQP